MITLEKILIEKHLSDRSISIKTQSVITIPHLWNEKYSPEEVDWQCVINVHLS